MRELRTLVESASHDNPHLTTRLEKAAFLLLLRGIVVIGHERYRVAAEDGLRDYQIINGHCECYGSIRHGAGHPCKHRLALAPCTLGYTIMWHLRSCSMQSKHQ